MFLVGVCYLNCSIIKIAFYSLLAFAHESTRVFVDYRD